VQSVGHVADADALPPDPDPDDDELDDDETQQQGVPSASVTMTPPLAMVNPPLAI
jgi:hypothetical protein